MGKLAIEQLCLGQANAAVFLSISDRLFQCVEQLGLVQQRIIIRDGVELDHVGKLALA